MIEVIPARETGKDARGKMSEIFVDGFHQWLRFFSEDKDRLRRAFAHMFNLDVFHAAVVDGVIAGIAACVDAGSPSVGLKRKELVKHLGLFRGGIASLVLRKEFEKRKYPFETEPGMGAVEFVAVAPSYRGRGAAKAMMNRIVERTPYASYVLEVADTNTAAVRLYEKLGYREFMRVRQRHAEKSGVNYLLYMRYDKRSGTMQS